MLTFHQKKRNNNSDLKRNAIKDSLGFRLWLIVVCCVFRPCKLIYSFFRVFTNLLTLEAHDSSFDTESEEADREENETDDHEENDPPGIDVR